MADPQHHDDAVPRTVGSLLVLLQFALIVVLAWRAVGAFATGAAPLLAWIAMLGGFALFAWTLTVNRLGNWSIHPLPKSGAVLVTDGPYRWIRHPMYSAVLACALGSVLAQPGVLTLCAALALVVVLWNKAALEEGLLAARYPAYESYRARTARFVPWIA